MWWRALSGWALSLALPLLLSACLGSGELPFGHDALYADTFSVGQTGDWDLEGDASGSAFIEADQLSISVSAANTIQYATLKQPEFTDFSLEVDATMLSGKDSDTYGVLFRLQDRAGEGSGVAFYRFELSAEGQYLLERHHPDGQWSRLTDGWRSSTAIRIGVGALNRLQIVAGGGSLSLYVNGTPLGTFTDPDPLVQGKVALDAGTYGPSNLLVTFDNLVVRAP